MYTTVVEFTLGVMAIGDPNGNVANDGVAGMEAPRTERTSGRDFDTVTRVLFAGMSGNFRCGPAPVDVFNVWVPLGKS